MSCKVGNQTNSQDPQAVNSRVFVGNLNTFQCSKTDVERIFQRYGRIAGISMHKGYAFIQFTNPFDARSACLGEDGRLIWGQTLDVNMVAEPKSHQTGRKRQNIAKTGNDWDYYYDSYYAQVGLPGPRLVPPMKRPRIHGPSSSNRPAVKAPSPNKSSHPNNNPNNLNVNNVMSVSSGGGSLTDLKTYSTPAILICGNCREHFTDVEQLLEHKKTYCKLRFTCKCHLLNGKGEEPAALLCSQCKDSFSSAWDLMVHVQAAHMLNIYQLSSDPSSGGSSRDQSETREFKHISGMIGDGLIPNGLNPNGTLMGDSLMEDSHCQTDLSSTTSSSSSSTTSSIAGSTGGGGLISPNNHLHLQNHHLLQQQQQQQQFHNHHHQQQQQHHLNQLNHLQSQQMQQQQPQQQSHLSYHHLHSNDSSTMTADVSTSTGIDNIAMSSSSATHQQHIITSGAPVNNGNNCMVVDSLIGGVGGGPQVGMATATSAQTTPITNLIIMTDGHNNPNGANQTLINGSNEGGGGGLMCSSSQCSTSVNHTNGPFVTSSGQVQTGSPINIINANNNNVTNTSSSTSSSSSASSTSSTSSSFESSTILSSSQPMEASTQTQTMQVDESSSSSPLHQNNNGPAAVVTTVASATAMTNNNQVVGGNGTAISTGFDEPCSIVSTLKQEGNIHLPFSNGQVASM